MKKEIISRLHKNFEEYVHVVDGIEFWYARELQTLLGYARWENFESALKRAKDACKGSKQDISDHFRDVTKTIPMLKRESKEISKLLA